MDWPISWRLAPQSPADDRSGVVGDRHSDFQPRVPPGDPSGDGGQWTKGTGSTGAKRSFLGPPPAAVVAAPAGGMAAELSAALSRLIAAGAARATLLGGLLIPTNKMHIESGEVPGSKHVRYHYDEGFLTLSRLGPTGETEILFHGHHEPDGSFINADGDALARDMGRGVFIDGNAVRRLDIRTATRGHVDRLANDNEPSANDNLRYCPPPTDDFLNNDLSAWPKYQSQVSGLPAGSSVEYNHYKFDGCDEARRVMLEAKDHYEQFLNKDKTDWLPWFKRRGEKRMMKEMEDQLRAARGRLIEWNFAEKAVADVVRRKVEARAKTDPSFQRIIVVHQQRHGE